MKTVEEENEECASQLFRLLNYMGNSPRLQQTITEKLRSEHRTIQQSFFRLVNDVAVKYAEDDAGSDLRNEASKDFALKVKALGAHFPYV